MAEPETAVEQPDWSMLPTPAVAIILRHLHMDDSSDCSSSTQQDSSETELEGPMAQPDWSTLPAPAVANILRHLRMGDRYHAAVTCRAWLSVLCYPEVWRTCQLHAQRRTTEQLVELARHVGRYIRRLTLYLCERCPGCRSSADCSCSQRQSRAAAQALGALRFGGTCRLRSVVFTGLSRFSDCNDGRAKSRLVTAMVRFLNGQTLLQSVQVQSAGLSGEDVLSLVRAAAFRSSATLSVVRLDGALGAEYDFHVPSVTPFPLPHKVVDTVPQLRLLSLSTCQLSDHLLHALPPTLERLLLVARQVDPPDPDVVTARGWANATTRLPNLDVELVLVGLLSPLGLFSVLPDSRCAAPVRVLRLRGRPLRRTSNLMAVQLSEGLLYAAHRFASTLRELDVRCRWLWLGPPLDVLLQELSLRLPHLRKLSYHGPLKNTDNVRNATLHAGTRSSRAKTSQATKT